VWSAAATAVRPIFLSTSRSHYLAESMEITTGNMVRSPAFTDDMALQMVGASYIVAN
jgi:hypothetical protein